VPPSGFVTTTSYVPGVMPVGTWASRRPASIRATLRQKVVPIRTEGVATKLSPVMITSTTLLFGPRSGSIWISAGAGGPFTASVTFSLEVCPSGFVTRTGHLPGARVPGE